jgi:peptide chain release factor subunit 3
LNKENKRSKKPPTFARKGDKVVVELVAATPICLELFKDYPMLGRFTLRDQGMLKSRVQLTTATTVAIGKVTNLVME